MKNVMAGLALVLSLAAAPLAGAQAPQAAPGTTCHLGDCSDSRNGSEE